MTDNQGGEIIKLYKNEGETPLACLDQFRVTHPEFANRSLTYVGRLDPMAEGLLLVLVDGTAIEREEYLGLDKVYRIEVLFGVSTDTGDVLGLVNQCASDLARVDEARLCEVLRLQLGVQNKFYPHYSSKPVLGKPLFQWAREGRLGEITIPTHEVEIKSIELVAMRQADGVKLQEEIHQRIDRVVGDFRQEEIKRRWQEVLAAHQHGSFVITEFVVVCGSGTYMRALAEDIGVSLGVPALAYRIRRERVGEYTIGDIGWPASHF